MGRGALAGVLAAAALAGLPAAAQAEQINMGPGDITSGPFAVSARQFTFVQIGDAKRYTLTAPADGLVNKWSVNMSVGGAIRLLALQPNGDGTYTEDGKTQDVTVGPGRTDITNAPLYLPEGDALGLQLVGPDARVLVRVEQGGEFRARDDGNGQGNFTNWPGYYILMRAELQVPAEAPKGGGTPNPLEQIPRITFPEFPSGGGNGGGSGSEPQPAPSAPPAPVISGVTPGAGTTAGGQAVTITGQNFDSVRSVFFGGTEARSFSVDSFNTITAITPAHGEGAVNVEVVNAGGLSSTSAGSVFRFVAPAPVQTTAPSAQPASVPKPRVRCVHAPTLIGRSVSGARRILRRAGCGSNLRIVMVGRRVGQRKVKVRSQSPRPRALMRTDRRIYLRVR